MKLYLANQRQGTAKIKEEVNCQEVQENYLDKRVPWCKTGDIKSPLLRGGARDWTRSRDYSFKLNKKLDN